jgi:hypothetical protein
MKELTIDITMNKKLRTQSIDTKQQKGMLEWFPRMMREKRNSTTSDTVTLTQLKAAKSTSLPSICLATIQNCVFFQVEK